MDADERSPERGALGVGHAGDGAAPPLGVPLAAPEGFAVQLDVFDGPFDLLLALIGKHELDVVEVSLSAVTGEFIAYVRALDERGQLEQSSQFLVVAATLLDLKAASLLPRGEAVDADDIAALEERDLLFARLLQYRAFKHVAGWLGRQLDREAARIARVSSISRELGGEPVPPPWQLTPQEFAALAEVALAPRPAAVVRFDHLHASTVSVRDEAVAVAGRLRHDGKATFSALVDGVTSRAVVVARFLAVLELFRQAAVAFAQSQPLGELSITWTAEQWSDDNLTALGADYE